VKKARPRSDVERDVEVVKAFIHVYCRRKHGVKVGDLCGECAGLSEYAVMRLEKCPYDPKPKCKDCKTHCYRAEERKRIQEIMRLAGMHFVKRGRVYWLWKYFR
jgi:hypothetical protein